MDACQNVFARFFFTILSDNAQITACLSAEYFGDCWIDALTCILFGIMSVEDGQTISFFSVETVAVKFDIQASVSTATQNFLLEKGKVTFKKKYILLYFTLTHVRIMTIGGKKMYVFCTLWK